jgi:gamma-glutamyltranspeptidase/glutathione hydrolase
MTQLLANIVVFGLDPQQAVEAPRFASYSFPLTSMDALYEPGLLRCEAGVGAETLAELSSRGHNVEDWGDRNYLAGGLCAIQVDPESGILTAGADFRRDCYAMGR